MQVYVQSGDSFAFNYILDGDMQRIYKEFAFGGRAVSKFSFDKDGRVIGERRLAIGADYTSRFIYATQNHSPDYMLSNFTGQLKKYFFIKDQLGSILQVVDENGVAVQEIQYDEFGQILSDTNPGLQAFGFAGGIYDRDTGLVRFGARDYNAETGRWLERDPILFDGGLTNLYDYCNNDPVNCIDPSGLLFEKWIASRTTIQQQATIAAFLGLAGATAINTGYGLTSTIGGADLTCFFRPPEFIV